MTKPAAKLKKSRAQIQKEYRARQKENSNYSEIREKNRARAQTNRDNKKSFLTTLSTKARVEILAKNRQMEADRKRIYRLKQNNPISPTKAFKRAQNRGKAVKRVLRALPANKDLAVEVLELVSQKVPKRKTKSLENTEHNLSTENVVKIKDFFESDEISWISPLMKQRSRLDATTAVRNMVLPIREAYAEFKAQHPDVTVGLTLFGQLRPAHVKTFQKTPENMCVCAIHANFGYLLTALYNFDKEIFVEFSTIRNFVAKVVCADSTDDCFLNKCEQCKNGKKIKPLLDDVVDQDKVLKYYKWESIKKKNFTVDEKSVYQETVTEIFQHVLNDLNKLLKHILIKNAQSKSFDHDKNLAMEIDSSIAVLEVDFAENFKCTGQDQTQNANFCYNQVSIFTIGFWHRGMDHSVIVSDSLDHRKDAIVPFLHEIIKALPPTVKRLVIYSDNPTSQFKNKFIMYSIIKLGQIFNINISWAFFCPQHGKGIVDGLGATVKTYVRYRVVNRRFVVNNAEDFVAALEGINLKVLYVPASKIQQITEDLDLNSVFSSSKTIEGITSHYFVRIENNRPKLYFLSKDEPN